MKASLLLQYKSVLLCNPGTRCIDKPNNLDPTVRIGAFVRQTKIVIRSSSTTRTVEKGMQSYVGNKGIFGKHN
jgi:hypothetical protein